MMTVNLALLRELGKLRQADLLRSAGFRAKEADR